ncbi:hypothetical protein ACF0H5_015048 [Mactra antiquata]
MSSEQSKTTATSNGNSMSGKTVKTDDQVVPSPDNPEVIDDADVADFVMVDRNIPEDKRIGQQQPGSWYYPLDMLYSAYYTTNRMFETHREESSPCPKRQFVAERLAEVNSLQDESQKRACLAKAVADNSVDIIENTDLTEEELKGLKTEKCISYQDYKHILHSRSITWINHLYCMIMMRDYRTHLVFLTYLKMDVFEKVVATYNQLIENDTTQPSLCPHCILLSTVNIIYVAPSLLGCDAGTWGPLTQAAIDVIGDMRKSQELWQMLIEILQKNPEQKSVVLNCIIKSLEDYGFHSDVVRMLKEDKTVGRDSLQCRIVSPQATLYDDKEVQTDPYPVLERQYAGGKSSGHSSLKRKSRRNDSNDQTKKKSLYDDKSGMDSGPKMSNLKIGNPEYDGVDEGISSLSSCGSSNSDTSVPMVDDETHRKYTVACETQTSLEDNANIMTTGSSNLDSDDNASYQEPYLNIVLEPKKKNDN